MTTIYLDKELYLWGTKPWYGKGLPYGDRAYYKYPATNQELYLLETEWDAPENIIDKNLLRKHTNKYN